MQTELDKIKIEVTRRVYILFMSKFEGNKSTFAKSAGCDEKTIRLLLDHNQEMTLNLLFKISNALEVEASELIKDLSIKKEICL